MLVPIINRLATLKENYESVLIIYESKITGSKILFDIAFLSILRR